MPKLSIYVPDDLWAKSHGVEPSLNPSQLVQTALRRYVDLAGGRPIFARERPAGAEVTLDRLRERLGGEARMEYEHGYHVALEIADWLPWKAIDVLPGLNWDLDVWRENLVHSPAISIPVDVAERVDQRLVEENYPPVSSSTFEVGFIDALRSLWNSVMQGQSASSEPKEGAA